MTNMASVNRIRRRSSGTWKMVRSFSSMIRSGLRVRGDHFAAGRFDGLARGAARGVHLDGERHLEVATREQLDGTLPAHETLRLEPRRVDGRAPRCAAACGCRARAPWHPGLSDARSRSSSG